MKTVIIYQSKYGVTEAYAKSLAEQINCQLFEAKSFNPSQFADYDTIIYGGGLYAGNISGIKLLKQNKESIKKKHIIVFTTGLIPPDNTEWYKKMMENVFGMEFLRCITAFHLMGDMEFEKLGFMHKKLIQIIEKSAKKKTELNDEESAMINALKRGSQGINTNQLAPLVTYIESLIPVQIA